MHANFRLHATRIAPLTVSSFLLWSCPEDGILAFCEGRMPFSVASSLTPVLLKGRQPSQLKGWYKAKGAWFVPETAYLAISDPQPAGTFCPSSTTCKYFSVLQIHRPRVL
jgi:hypothetical protein